MIKRNSKKKIIQAYCQLLEELPFHKVTTADIYRKAKISRSSFYNYFHNILEVEKGALNFLLDNITTIINKNLIISQNPTSEILYFLYENRDICYPLFTKSPSKDLLVEKYINESIIYSGIDNLYETLEKSYQVPTKYAFQLYVTGVKTIITTWIHSNFEETPDQITNIIFKATPSNLFKRQ